MTNLIKEQNETPIPEKPPEPCGSGGLIGYSLMMTSSAASTMWSTVRPKRSAR